jgi:hypothetical protein
MFWDFYVPKFIKNKKATIADVKLAVLGVNVEAK